MLAHTIHLIEKIDPLKYLLGKATLMGRLAKWMMILLEFDIEYIERKAIKGQAIVDQLADSQYKIMHLFKFTCQMNTSCI